MGVFNRDIVPFNRGNGRKHNYGPVDPFPSLFISTFASSPRCIASSRRNGEGEGGGGLKQNFSNPRFFLFFTLAFRAGARECMVAYFK